MENKKNKQELLKESQDLAEKHAQLKKTIDSMVNALDNAVIELGEIEVEYNKVIELIKK